MGDGTATRCSSPMRSGISASAGTSRAVGSRAGVPSKSPSAAARGGLPPGRRGRATDARRDRGRRGPARRCAPVARRGEGGSGGVRGDHVRRPDRRGATAAAERDLKHSAVADREIGHAGASCAGSEPAAPEGPGLCALRLREGCAHLGLGRVDAEPVREPLSAAGRRHLDDAAAAEADPNAGVVPAGPALPDRAAELGRNLRRGHSEERPRTYPGRA